MKTEFNTKKRKSNPPYFAQHTRGPPPFEPRSPFCTFIPGLTRNPDFCIILPMATDENNSVSSDKADCNNPENIKKRRFSLGFIFCLMLIILAAAFTVRTYFRMNEDPLEVWMPVLAGKTNPPIFAIYVDRTMSISHSRSSDIWSEPRTYVIIALWPDGKIVWSQDRQNGGQPYFIHTLVKESIPQLFENLDSLGLFTNTLRGNKDLIIEGDSTVLAVFDGSKRVSMESYHEIYETNPNLIATDWGLQALEGQTREEVWAEQPDHYKRFRKIWTDVRLEAEKLIPDKGEPLEGVRFETEILKPTVFRFFVIETLFPWLCPQPREPSGKGVRLLLKR
jgi:hypothetical protein